MMELGDLLDLVSKGQEIELTDQVRVVARLVPAIQRVFGCQAGSISIRDDFDEPLDNFKGYGGA